MNTKKDHPGNVYARATENLASLKALYPHQFPEPGWAYSWPGGWHRLIVEACAGLAHLQPEGHWLQIKEKFAGLHLYYHDGPLRLDLHTRKGVITAALDPDGGPVTPSALNLLISTLEDASLQTCALCGGQHGAGRAVNLSGWWITVCETCEPIVRAYRALPWGSDER